MAQEIISINRESCTGCGICVTDCLRRRLHLSGGKAAINHEILCIECGHCVAVCPEGCYRMLGYDMGEVNEYAQDSFRIPADTLLNFIKFRRSVRQFKDKTIPKVTLQRVLEAGRYTPTAANRQTVRYIILKDQLPQIRERALKTLHDIARNNPDDHAVSNLGVYRAKWIANYQNYLKDGTDRLFFGAPVVILVISTGIQNGWAELNAGLAAQSIDLMLNAEGLGSCHIGFFGIACRVCPELLASLGIKEDEVLVTTLAVGYPKISYKRTTVRKPTRITEL